MHVTASRCMRLPEGPSPGAAILGVMRTSGPETPAPASAHSIDVERDPLYLALRGAADAVERNPSILFEKDPTWDEGLRLSLINSLASDCALCSTPIITVDVEYEAPERPELRTLVFAPIGSESPVRCRYWSRYGTRDTVTPGLTVEIVGRLRAWQSERAVQLEADDGDWFTLNVFDGTRTTVRGADRSESARVERVKAELAFQAQRLGLATPGASDVEIARAVRRWFTLDGRIAPHMIGRTAVAAAVEMLRGVRSARDKGLRNSKPGRPAHPESATSRFLSLVREAGSITRKELKRRGVTNPSDTFGKISRMPDCRTQVKKVGGRGNEAVRYVWIKK